MSDHPKQLETENGTYVRLDEGLPEAMENLAAVLGVAHIQTLERPDGPGVALYVPEWQYEKATGVHVWATVENVAGWTEEQRRAFVANNRGRRRSTR